MAILEAQELRETWDMQLDACTSRIMSEEVKLAPGHMLNVLEIETDILSAPGDAVKCIKVLEVRMCSKEGKIETMVVSFCSEGLQQMFLDRFDFGGAVPKLEQATRTKIEQDAHT